jgi:hypothetical protein
MAENITRTNLPLRAMVQPLNLAGSVARIDPTVLSNIRRVGLDKAVLRPFAPLTPLVPPVRVPTPTPPSAPPAASPPVAPAAPVDVPDAPASDPFENLPFPQPGDRIRAEDFQTLSTALRMIHDAFAISGALFGVDFATARQVLAANSYQIVQVVSVFGTEITNPDDPAHAQRRVIQVMPDDLGTNQVNVVLTEEVREPEMRMPNLVGLTYEQAQTEMQRVLRGVVDENATMAVPNLVGQTLGQAADQLT